MAAAVNTEGTGSNKKNFDKWQKYQKMEGRIHMKELPPEDFALNTVTTVNPHVYADELYEARRNEIYQEKAQKATQRRELRAKAKKKEEKLFIRRINEEAAPPWYQDLSTRQMEITDDLKSKLLSDIECKTADLTLAYLNDLGVTPPICRKEIYRIVKDTDGEAVRFLLTVHRCLAFKEQDEYEQDYEKYHLSRLPVSNFSVNERLLLSAAFYLHLPILKKKLVKMLPPPPEPLRVKWAEKKKEKKETYPSPYLEPQPITDMCWYEERAYADLRAKVMKQIERQKKRDEYLESLKPKKNLELELIEQEKDNESEIWDDWLFDEQPAKETAKKKKLKKLNSIEELDAALKEDEIYLLSNPVSDTNLYESSKPQHEESKKEDKGAKVPAILTFYEGYKDIRVEPNAREEVVDEDDPVEGISSPETHLTSFVKGKLIQKSSVASQTLFDPALGTLADHLRSEHDLKAAIALSSLASQDQDLNLNKNFLTNGYNDYREEEPADTLVNLMTEIREDLNLLRGVERYKVFKAKSEESLLTLLSDSSYLSVESYLYDSDYREGRSEDAKKFKLERKSRRTEKAFNSKKNSSFNVECWDDQCGLVSSDEEIPMDEFKLAKKIIANLPKDQALEYAVKYLKDTGDPMAALPDVHRIPNLIAWYDNRSTLKTPKMRAQENKELLKKSLHMWGNSYFDVNSMRIPQVPLPRCVTWDMIEKVKFEANKMKSKHFRFVKQQLVTNTRNYFPSMFVDNYNTKLMKNFRKTFFAYLPSKELDTITYFLWKRPIEEKVDIARCYQSNDGIVHIPLIRGKRRKMTKKEVARKMSKSRRSRSKTVISFAVRSNKSYGS